MKRARQIVWISVFIYLVLSSVPVRALPGRTDNLITYYNSEPPLERGDQFKWVVEGFTINDSLELDTTSDLIPIKSINMLKLEILLSLNGISEYEVWFSRFFDVQSEFTYQHNGSSHTESVDLNYLGVPLLIPTSIKFDEGDYRNYFELIRSFNPESEKYSTPVENVGATQTTIITSYSLMDEIYMEKVVSNTILIPTDISQAPINQTMQTSTTRIDIQTGILDEYSIEYYDLQVGTTHNSSIIKAEEPSKGLLDIDFPRSPFSITLLSVSIFILIIFAIRFKNRNDPGKFRMDKEGPEA